ncbi:hypothetical protein BH23ACT9_BH23ACT9_09040 [soil metagenome]
MIPVDLPDLPSWLHTRRWWSGKGRPVTGVAAIDVIPVAAGTWLTTIEVDYDDGGPAERWLLVLAAAGQGASSVIGTVEGQPVVEIGDRPEAAAGLLAAMADGVTLQGSTGTVATAFAVGDLVVEGLVVEGLGTEIRPMGVEQSNTSVVIGNAVAVKVVRHLEAGPNPDVEVGTALTTAGFEGSPALLGALVGPEQTAMAVASRFVPGARDGWALAVEEAAGVTDHSIAAGLADLGALTASMHETLREVLPTARSTAEDAERWRSSMAADLAVTRRLVASSDAAARLRGKVRAAIAGAPTDMGVLQRIHGDYHLGQVLRDGGGRWWILDFEGEPGRPVAERRQPAHPARDVAGMLRSFDYARAQAIRDGGDPEVAQSWADQAREAYLTGYGEEGRDWLHPFEVEKLLYEVRYEAANRPDWLGIPLAALGLGQRLGQRTGQRDGRAGSRPSRGAWVEPSTPIPAPLATSSPTSRPTDHPMPSPDLPAADEPDGPTVAPDHAVLEAAAALTEGRLHDPHGLLGFHQTADGWVVRAWRPGAESVGYLATAEADPIGCTEVVSGLFEVRLTEAPRAGAYRLRVAYPGGGIYDLVDPYSFPPSLGDIDMHLLAEGRHEQAWTVMGANRLTMEGIDGVGFAVWAPNAKAVRVTGDFNSWAGRLHPMRSMGESGIWELFLPDVPDGSHYKYELITADGVEVTRADPWAKWSDVPPGTASRVFTSSYEPRDVERPRPEPLTGPMSTYEVHLGSWRHRDGQPLSYRDVAPQLADYCNELGFTHVEFLPVAEHPFGGSWGYQVTGQFAPTSRFGSPDDFRYLVDHLHQQGIGVIVDWVPAHFPKDEWALRLFDGTALYEHEDPRLGEHPDWGTMVFNYGRTEVRNFLVASALYWLEVLGIDGLRVDAVASMLYLDYSREAGQWIPNEHGGRENLRAVELLQEVNATVYKRNPGVYTIAEESTAWPGVSRPTHLGGLGFGFKWNMGWMHDTLAYFSREPVYRRWHHNQLTFGMMYAFSENFVLPLSHDEVVHGKGSLLGKMPGDRWQQMANLRALYGWMWGHPGKKLLFMGGEFGQEREWSEERELDWFLLGDQGHAGMQRMVADLNRAYRSLPALWTRDADPDGFQWIDANNADDNVLLFLRRGDEGDPDVAVIANLSPEPRYGMRVGLSVTGHWDEVLNTDAASYGGANIGNLGGVEATDQSWHGMPSSALVTCPPLAVVWLRGPLIEGAAA